MPDIDPIYDWLRAIQAQLTWIAVLLFAILTLAFYAMMIWAPAGWWHTPFWALG